MEEKIIKFEDIKNIAKPKRKTLVEISVVRAIAMFSVVGIHFLNLPVSNIQNGAASQGNFYVVRAMLVFAVPTFIFLSTMMISYTGETSNLKKFYSKKFYRIGLPYLLWSLFYIILVRLAVDGVYFKNYISENIWNFIFYGKSYEHLYFMPILLEFIILAPIFVYVSKNIKDYPIIAFLVAIGVQTVIYFLNKNFIQEHFKMLTSTFLWYFSVGFLGFWFGHNYKKNMEFLHKHRYKIILIFLISAIADFEYQKILWHSLWEVVKFNTLYYTVNLHLYMIFAVFVLLLIGKAVSSKETSSYETALINRRSKVKTSQKIYNLCMWIAPMSYGVYLMHPVFTALTKKIIISSSGALWTVVVIVGVFLVSLICAKITEKLQHAPIIAIVFGNPINIGKNKKM